MFLKPPTPHEKEQFDSLITVIIPIFCGLLLAETQRGTLWQFQILMVIGFLFSIYAGWNVRIAIMIFITLVASCIHNRILNNREAEEERVRREANYVQQIAHLTTVIQKSPFIMVP
jgi:membrane protein implicated in regulation of membrane protease activity